VESIGEALGAGLFPAPATPINSTIGPHRRFDWAEMDLDAMKSVRTRLGGTINDIVLAVFTGGMRRFLRGRGVDVEHLDFRAMMPVNVRTAETRASLGNRVAMIVGHLPLDERDPRERLQRVIRETTELKRSHQAAGVQTIEDLSDASFTTLMVEFSRLAAFVRPFNVVVTNVPGPSFSAYVLGARMLASYPLVPLFRDQGLGVALFSYAGRLYWGFNADWDLVPDLHDLVEAVNLEFETLCSAAGAAAAAEDPEHGNGTTAGAHAAGDGAANGRIPAPARA
jgi:WS/DGAT/MGAT family acyltransferase